MARRVVFVLVLLACGCGGRKGVYVVSEGGAPPEAGPDAGAGGAPEAGSDAADAGDGGQTPACIDACATALSVGCQNDDMNDCLYACSDTRAQFPACASAFDAFNACAAAQPPGHYYCDMDGFATLDAGYCATEKSAFAACLHAQP